MFQFLRIAAWACLIAIAAATLSPIGLRPRFPAPVAVEHVVAFAVLGCLFALAYPKNILVAALAVLASVVGLELLQLLSADRHARISDASIKVIGATLGLLLGWIISRFRLGTTHRP